MSTALCTIPLWVRSGHHVHSTFCTVPLWVTEAGPGLYTIRLWVRPDHDVHSTLYNSSLGQAGPPCSQHSVCTIPLWVRPDHHVHNTLYNSSLGQAGPQCPQHSVQFLSGSGRTTMFTALCTIPLWVRPDHNVHSTFCTVPLWVRSDHHVHSTLYNSSMGQAGPPCSQHSVQFLSGSGRTTMSTARSALSLSGSLRPDRCTELHIAQWTDLLCSTAGA